MKRYFSILFLLLLPFALFSRNRLDGVEPWHLSLGIGITPFAHYYGYSEWENRNGKAQVINPTYQELMFHYSLSKKVQVGAGLNFLATIVNEKQDDPYMSTEEHEDTIPHFLFQTRMTYYFDRIGTGPYIDGGIGYEFIEGFGLQGGLGYAIELNKKETSLLLGIKYTYINGVHHPMNLDIFPDNNDTPDEPNHSYAVSIISLYASILW